MYVPVYISRVTDAPPIPYSTSIPSEEEGWTDSSARVIRNISSTPLPVDTSTTTAGSVVALDEEHATMFEALSLQNKSGTDTLLNVLHGLSHQVDKQTTDMEDLAYMLLYAIIASTTVVILLCHARKLVLNSGLCATALGECCKKAGKKNSSTSGHYKPVDQAPEEALVNLMEGFRQAQMEERRFLTNLRHSFLMKQQADMEQGAAQPSPSFKTLNGSFGYPLAGDKNKTHVHIEMQPRDTSGSPDDPPAQEQKGPQEPKKNGDGAEGSAA